ncbi:RNA polymerase II-associated protein 1-like isoform X1 [Periplaneta americana]|uniref:RNA polymerase II-associated protein 1-like isoform X1 n=1 Tax=Periplaneta americana TaxID=6978 RepID=UPI0037E7A7C6
MATISVTARFCYLSTVFLAGNDLFLEPEVHHHLDTLLRILLRNNSNLNFNEKIPGFTSFYDLYTQLVEQFAAVSYGDELFGHFVMIPLQQRHSPSYRKLVWSEQAAILRVLRTPPHQLAVPLQAYLEPYEMDPSLLMCYLNGLATGQVREIWCPVLYKVAVHHVATFISQQPNTSIAQQLSSRIQKLGNKDLRNLFSTYCSVTT